MKDEKIANLALITGVIGIPVLFLLITIINLLNLTKFISTNLFIFLILIIPVIILINSVIGGIYGLIKFKDNKLKIKCLMGIIFAIISIFLMFIFLFTGTGPPPKNDVGSCKLAAANCASELATSGGNAPCNYCEMECDDESIGVNESYTNAIEACKAGDPTAIFAK